MAGTGHGQSVVFGSTTLPNVETVTVNSKGRILDKVVADAAYPITTTVPGLAKVTVVWNLPASTPHTTLAALAQGTTGTIAVDGVDGVKFSSSTAESAGYDVSSPSGGWVTVTSEFTISGALTVAAET